MNEMNIKDDAIRRVLQKRKAVIEDLEKNLNP